jgi:hypothetical protein
MHALDSTSGAAALLRFSGQLARRSKNGVASLRPATADAIIISVFSVILLILEYTYELAPLFCQFAPDHAE